MWVDNNAELASRFCLVYRQINLTPQDQISEWLDLQHCGKDMRIQTFLQSRQAFERVINLPLRPDLL